MNFVVGDRVRVDCGTGSGVTRQKLVVFSGLVTKVDGDHVWVADEMLARSKGLKVLARDCRLSASVNTPPGGGFPSNPISVSSSCITFRDAPPFFFGPNSWDSHQLPLTAYVAKTTHRSWGCSHRYWKSQ